MKYYIIAGEASGDLHGSNLMKELALQDTAAKFRYWGGDLMQKQGGKLVNHYKDLAFMGFTEVLMNIKTILSNIKFCKKDILKHKPDVLILIDYPGFNLRIADFAHTNNIKVFYYISPQIWAWKESRVHKIKKVVDKMFVILPFEKDFYDKYDYKVDFIGHPLLDAIENNKNEKKELNIKTDKPIIAVLPGSRKQEIKTMLPLMLLMVKYFKDYKFVIAGAPSMEAAFYKEVINGIDVEVVFDDTYTLLQQADAALVTSGTATLETALFGTPEVVCYKGGAISYAIAKQLVKVDYISLVNLVMNKEIVTELVQKKLNEKSLKNELEKLFIPESREVMINNFKDLKSKLGGVGASKNAATKMIEYLKQ